MNEGGPISSLQRGDLARPGGLAGPVIRDGEVGVIGGVEEGVKLVVLALADGVVLVGMTGGAAEREPQPDGGGRLGPILDGVGAKLFLVAGRGRVVQRVAVQAGR